MINSSVSFNDILIKLGDLEQPFPAKYLQFFSDLIGDQATQLQNLWKNLSTKRKLAFLEDLDDLGEHDSLMDFTAAGYIAINDVDEQIREAALHLFWNCEDKAFIPVGLILLEDDPSARVRATAASIMGHFVFMSETEDIPEESGNLIVDALLERHKNDLDKQVKRKSLESLGYSSRPEVSQLIKQAVATQDNEWLASGLYAMGRSADPSWAKQIGIHIRNEEPVVREEAVRAAGELELKDLREVILSLLEEDEDDDVRAAAIWSLSQIGGEGVRETFAQLLETADDDEFMDFLENALDNLNFTEELAQFDLFEIDDDGNDA